MERKLVERVRAGGMHPSDTKDSLQHHQTKEAG
jgi:hypothetical protein